RKHRDMAVDLVAVEGGLVMHHKIQQLLVREGDPDCVLDKFRKVAARIDLGAQIFPRGANPHADHPATQHPQPPCSAADSSVKERPSSAGYNTRASGSR